jgi:hypothetical protein
MVCARASADTQGSPVCVQYEPGEPNPAGCVFVSHYRENLTAQFHITLHTISALAYSMFREANNFRGLSRINRFAAQSMYRQGLADTFEHERSD